MMPVEGSEGLLAGDERHDQEHRQSLGYWNESPVLVGSLEGTKVVYVLLIYL